MKIKSKLSSISDRVIKKGLSPPFLMYIDGINLSPQWLIQVSQRLPLILRLQILPLPFGLCCS